MPVSLRKTPFDGGQPPPKMRTPQVRALLALLPAPDDEPFDWRVMTKARLGAALGCTLLSGTITRVLNGIREGSSSGEAHPGLLALGLLEEVALDIMGRTEVNYRITVAGVAACSAHVREYGPPPKLRSAECSTNNRYRRKPT